MSTDSVVKPHVQVLLEDVQRVLRHSEHRESLEVREKVGRLLGAMKHKRIDDQQVFAQWKPTEANIRALPAPIRAHIEDCERLIKENEAVREQLTVKVRQLNKLLSERWEDPDIFARVTEILEALQ